jgi:hypothetical protein
VIERWRKWEVRSVFQDLIVRKDRERLTPFRRGLEKGMDLDSLFWISAVSAFSFPLFGQSG